MDAVLQAAFQSAPQLGAMGGFVWLVLVLLRRESTSEERHAAELARINANHDAELAERNAEVDKARAAADKTNQRLDDERERRRKAEDDLAAARRGSAM